MKNILLTTTTLLCFIFSFSQQEFYEKLEFGPHFVGFADTILFDKSEPMYSYGYSGPAPLFVKAWFPVNFRPKSRIMRYGEFRNGKVPEMFQDYQRAINHHMDSSFIKYNLSENYKTGDSIKYKGYNYFQILDKIKNFATRSVRRRFPFGENLKIVIYHHGAQGFSDENHILFEYLASYGFLVISANFHQAYEGKFYGYNERGETYNIDAPKRIIEFAHSISKNDTVAFIGHSYGAQTGFKFLNEDGWANTFISLESTLEFYDSTKISKTWPDLSRHIQTHKGDYQNLDMIIMMANNGKKKNFDFTFFNQLDSVFIFELIPKIEFGHESYTSAYLMRYFLNSKNKLENKKIKIPNRKFLKTQVEQYCSNLLLIKSILNNYVQIKNLNRYYNRIINSKWNNKGFISGYIYNIKNGKKVPSKGVVIELFEDKYFWETTSDSGEFKISQDYPKLDSVHIMIYDQDFHKWKANFALNKLEKSTPTLYLKVATPSVDTIHYYKIHFPGNECDYSVKKPRCPRCNKKDKVIEIVYGFPPKKILDLAKKGKVLIQKKLLEGCEPRWYCKREKYSFIRNK